MDNAPYPIGYQFPETYCGTEAGSYSRLIDSCITQLKVQGPSRTCDETKEEAEEDNAPHPNRQAHVQVTRMQAKRATPGGMFYPTDNAPCPNGQSTLS